MGSIEISPPTKETETLCSKRSVCRLPLMFSQNSEREREKGTVLVGQSDAPTSLSDDDEEGEKEEEGENGTLVPCLTPDFCSDIYLLPETRCGRYNPAPSSSSWTVCASVGGAGIQKRVTQRRRTNRRRCRLPSRNSSEDDDGGGVVVCCGGVIFPEHSERGHLVPIVPLNESAFTV